VRCHLDSELVMNWSMMTGAVGKVAELGLPEAKHFGIVEGVAVVEAEDGGFDRLSCGRRCEPDWARCASTAHRACGC